ncbi:hypothetical protein SASPL_154262 [Salvia splendens]|uniref:Retrovirus-related Pol polyprotein from transposon TNT 1-94-like beta-barrel domain-containing protein n=1 Tax=Salvia splendens TaxID=180675 RepID=A0A8X8YZP1_SALSN|nr:hypothetical protein SASPL_154262 [Salvia splendens]
MHRKTVGYIRRFIEHNIFHHFANEEKADVLWKKIEPMFERKNALNKASIIRKIVRLRYVESANMTNHLNAYKGLINQSINMKIFLDDEVIALLLLNSLLDSWDTLVPGGALTLQMVKDCLLNEESRRREQDHSSETKAMVAENSDRGRNKNRNSQNTRDKSRGKSKHKKDFKCHYCGGPIHYERDCRKNKRDQTWGNNENAEKDTTAIATDGDVVVCDGACVSSFGKVRMANHGVIEVAGIGDIHLPTDTRCKLILRDVRHVPDIRLSIISTGKLDDDGYINHFGEGKWKLIKGSLIAAKSIGHLCQKGLEILARRCLIPETGRKLKCVRADNDGEYQGPFELHCKNHEKPESNSEVPVNLDPVPSPTVQDYGGDIQPEQGDPIDDGAGDDDTRPAKDEVPPVRRSVRERLPSTRYSPHEYVMLTDGGEPQGFAEAMAHDQKEKWLEAMKEEMNSLHQNYTYDLVQLPAGKRPLKNKLV